MVATDWLPHFILLFPEHFIDIVSCISGTYRGGHEVLVRAKLALADGVTMQLTVRSDDPEVSEVIASAVG